MRYLITGAGLVGSAVAARLVEDGHEVRIVDVVSPPDAPTPVIRGDIRDLDKLMWLAKDTDGIFHTAALHGIHAKTNSPSEFMSINVLGTFNVLEAAHRNGVKRVVHSSTTGVFGAGLGDRNGPVPPTLTHDTPRMPGDYYGTSKLLAEELCVSYSRSKGLEVIALRYGGVRQLVQSLSGKVDLSWAMSGHLTDLRDAVNANVRAMEIEPLPPRDQYIVLPSTVFTASDFPAEDVRALLTSKVEWLSEKELPDQVPRPWSMFDASETEKDLGIQIEYGHEHFLREALGLDEGAGR